MLSGSVLMHTLATSFNMFRERQCWNMTRMSVRQVCEDHGTWVVQSYKTSSLYFLPCDMRSKVYVSQTFTLDIPKLVQK